MTLRRYLIVGVVALLAALLLDAPAATLYAWFHGKDSQASGQLAGLSGDLRSGRVAALMWNGQPLLADLSWSLHPLWLLAARLDFHIDGGGEDDAVSGDVGLWPGGRTSLRNLQLSTGVKPLLAASGFPIPWLDGRVSAQMPRLKLRHGVPVDAEGKLLVHGLSWGMGREPTALGDVAAEIARNGDAIVAKLSSVAGPLDLSGEGKLGDDGAYELKIQFKAKPDASPAVQNLLRQTGAPDLQGYFHLNRTGKLAAP
jgi:general secretion pathway protein N